jgi:uncharacterized protein YggU (UPF0235/DUF167 family)
MDQPSFIFPVHVHPGARHPGVGGLRGDHLVVRVRSRAVDGAANREVLAALAHALEVSPRDVTFVRVTRSRDKLIAVRDSPTVRSRHRTLRDSSDDEGAAL